MIRLHRHGFLFELQVFGFVLTIGCVLCIRNDEDSGNGRQRLKLPPVEAGDRMGYALYRGLYNDRLPGDWRVCPSFYAIRNRMLVG